MKPSGLFLLAAISLATAATASHRPHYGGTLRVLIQEAPTSLDPADPTQSGMLAAHGLSRLIFESLINVDAHGQAQPALASAWQANPGYQRWQFSMRQGVTFRDGTAMSAEAVAASLRAVSPNWKVFATGEAVVVECDVPTPQLPIVLALPRYAIVKRGGGKLAGSGPFAISQWEPGKKLVLIARDDYWGGRAFLDSIEIEMGKSFREQMIALDLGKADVVEVAPEQARHATAEGRRIQSSAPAEWMALVFGREVQSDEEGKVRDALALSINRAAINDVLMQGGGEPVGAFLPNWLSGYGFLFPATVDLQRARQFRSEVHTTPVLTLSYDAADALSHVVAERVALNAGDAGITIQNQIVQAKSPKLADLRLVRIPLPSLDARVALGALAGSAGLPAPKLDDGLAASLYAAENALLQTKRVIPLLYLRSAAALRPGVMDWREDPDGRWHLPDVWLETGKP
jgi:ABC-type transport system substrate-binding protein